MPTNEERRETAARLREIESEREWVREAFLASTLGALGLEARASVGEIMLRVADLIEPESERTCTFSIATGIDRPTCGVCGYEADSYECDICEENGKTHLEYSQNYCNGCGARVKEGTDA